MTSITGSVADLFATMGLDAAPLGAALAESEAMLKTAGANMTLTLQALQAEHTRLLASIGMKPVTALEAAYASMGVTATSSIHEVIAAHEELINREKAALLQEEMRLSAMNTIEGEITTTVALQEEARRAQHALTVAEEIAAEQRKQAAMHIIESEITQFIGAQERARTTTIAAEIAAQTALEKEAAASSAGRFGARIGPGGITPTGFLGGGAMIAGAAAAMGMYEVVKQATVLDDALNKSMSTMGDVSEMMQTKMRQAAMDLAAEYGIASADIAKAFYHLISSGMDAEKALATLPIVTKFAFTASAKGLMETGKAAELLTTTVNALHGAGGSIEHVADLLLKADMMAAGTGEQFAQALAGRGAGAIRILGKSMEEGIAILAAYSLVGIKGADAQSNMVQVLRDFRNEAEKHKNVMITLNSVTMAYRDLIYDSTGKMKPFADILGELEVLFRGASTATITHELALLGLNKRTTQAIQPLIGLSQTIRDFEEKAKSASGAMDEIAKKRLESPATAFDQLKESASNFAADLGEKVLPAVLGLTSALKLMLSLGRGSKAGDEFDVPFSRLGALNPFLTAAEAEKANEARIQKMVQLAQDNLRKNLPSSGTAASIMSDFWGNDSSVRDPDAEARAQAKLDAAERKRLAAEDKAARERNQVEVIEINSQEKHDLHLLRMEEDFIRHREKIREISADQALAQLNSLYAMEESITKDAVQKRLDLEHTSKSSVSDATSVAGTREAEDKIRARAQAALYHAEAEDQAQRDRIAHFSKFVQDLMEKDDRKAELQSEELNQKRADDRIKAQTMEVAGEMAHQTRILEMWRQLADLNQRRGIISVADRDHINEAISTQEEEMQRRSLQQELELLDAKLLGTATYASQRQTILDRQAVLDDARMARELKGAEQLPAHMSKAMEGFVRQTESGIRATAAGLADLITEGGKFGDRMDRVAKNIIKTLGTDVVEYGFGKMLMAIFNTDTALYNLGKRLSSVFGSSTRAVLGGTPGGITTGSFPQGVANVLTPPWMEANTGAIKSSTEQLAKDTAGTIKNTTAVIGDTSTEQVSMRRTADNTGATELNTRGVEPNTKATQDNTQALKDLLAEMKAHPWVCCCDAQGGGTTPIPVPVIILGGGGGGNQFGGSNFPFGLDPFGGQGGFGGYGGGGGWNGGDWWNEGWGDSFMGQAPQSTPTAGEQALHIDLRGSTFTGVTEDLVSSVLNKAVKRVRLNRGSL